MSAPSATQRLNESQLKGEAQAMEDELLRNDGYPQQLIYSLRAAGLDFSSIQALPKPAPATSAGTPLSDEYWRELTSQAVSSQTRPQGFCSAAAWPAGTVEEPISSDAIAEAAHWHGGSLDSFRQHCHCHHEG